MKTDNMYTVCHNPQEHNTNTNSVRVLQSTIARSMKSWQACTTQ
jgi:hypothetical protein